MVLRHFLSRASTVFRAERNHLCNFGISHFGEHFYEIIYIGSSGPGGDIIEGIF